MRRTHALGLAIVATLMAAGCAAQHTTERIHLRADSVPSVAPVTAGMQRAWLLGVGVEVPATWKQNDVHCGTPIADTLIVEYTGTATETCLLSRPPQQLSVVWMGPFHRPVVRGQTLGEATVPSDSAIDSYDDATVNGEAVKETTQRTRDGRTLRLVLFLSRGVFVSVASPDRSLVNDLVASLQTTDTDPSGCVVHTHAYNGGLAPADQHGHTIVPGVPTSADGCVYVDGWLEQTGPVDGARLVELVAALRHAPPTTKARAPDDTNCESVQPDPDPSSRAPLVLRFHYADGTGWTVVAQLEWCTRWQSFVTSGDVTRRIDQRLLLALPQLWTSYPDPDSMG